MTSQYLYTILIYPSSKEDACLGLFPLFIFLFFIFFKNLLVKISSSFKACSCYYKVIWVCKIQCPHIHCSSACHRLISYKNSPLWYPSNFSITSSQNSTSYEHAILLKCILCSSNTDNISPVCSTYSILIHLLLSEP